jgi:hypothetical protein
MVASRKKEAEKLPLEYLNIELFWVIKEELGVTRKFVQSMSDRLNTAFAGTSLKVNVIVSHIVVSMMVFTSERVTEDAK